MTLRQKSSWLCFFVDTLNRTQ